MKVQANRKILVVDDEAHIRLLIMQTLEDLEERGVEIFSAQDGREAILIAEQEHPRLVFLDVMMPNVDGLQVCHHIKHKLQFADTYVVILTAQGQAYDRQKSMEAGADKYIAKPFDPDEILLLASSILFDKTDD